jgi:hypothetical protein
MRRQVAHAIQRLAEGQGERLSRCNTYEQGTREAGKRRDCYRINIAKSDTSLRTCSLQRRDYCLEMGATGDLWDYSSETDVLVHTRSDFIREQRRAAYDSHTGLVARCLNT